MNTANLQIEGLLLAVAALCAELKEKGALSAGEIDGALARAEHGASTRIAAISEANGEAVRFPIRFLRLALQKDASALDYSAIAVEIGRTRAQLAP